MRELLLGLSVGPRDFALLLFYMSPMFMPLVLPLACMLGIFLSVLRMSADREILALKAGGVGLGGMLAAPLWFALLCCLLTLVISLHGISWGAEHFRSSVLRLARDRAELNLQPGIFNQDIRGLTMFARKMDVKTRELKQVFVEDANTDKRAHIAVLAPEGLITTDGRRGELVFQLRGGRIYRLGREAASVLDFDEYNIRISLDQLFNTAILGEMKPREMSWAELSRLKRGMARGKVKDSANKVLTEMQKRLSLPVASLVLGFFAVPLAAGFEGARRQFGIAAALLAFMLYYFLFSFGISLSESGRLRAEPALWLPNVVFLAAGLAGFAAAAREGLPDFAFFIRKRGGA
jgi:lipopolysaccharide export system permease protein